MLVALHELLKRLRLPAAPTILLFSNHPQGRVFKQRPIG